MTDHLLISFFVILLLLALSAFFSAAETALTAISRARLFKLVQDGNKAAKAASRLRRDKESLIATVLLGNTAINVAASALATSLAIAVFGAEGAPVAIVTAVLTLLLVVFSEILPKTYAIQNAEAVSLKLAGPVRLIVLLFKPVTWAVQHFNRFLLKLFNVDITQSTSLVPAADVIRGTIELHHREGEVVKQDRDMLGSILDLSEIEVSRIMTHRKEVEMIDADLPPDQLVAAAVATLHSRIPLWQGNPDNIIGVLHVKSLVKLLGERRGDSLTTGAILAFCRKPWFIPETTSLRHQLLAFRSRREHFALVVDEYGAWQGIVTLEDIIEEIVGNIEDEHDEADNNIQRAGPSAWFVNGDVPLRDINRSLDWNLPDEHASTVAGLLIHEAQAIPSVGEHFDAHGFRFTVVGKDATRITRLRIEKLPEASPENAEP
ncbi:MAG: DUF21 domain-containing protein [Pseudomonadota bacterium]|nr:DUF21 domain-containing protein [Pseudomonadota bacterium]